MTDLYDDLGVDRGADAKKIRRAYRRRAKSVHPDAGGSREEFDKIATALMVLSDPRRRAQYDETGQYDEGRPDNQMAETLNVIAGSLGRVLDQSRQGMPTMNFVQCMRNDIGKHKAGCVQQRAVAQSEINAVEKFARRFTKKKNGKNWLYEIARATVGSQQMIVDKCNNEIACADRALAFLADYDDAEATGDVRSPMGGLAAFAAQVQRGRMW